MFKPKISIIVPVYNTGDLLNKCIQSVLKQQYENYEIIIVDDGSDDETASICDEIKNSDDRIKVYHKSNGGQLHTRVFGIQHSTGDYIMFLDSDDYLCNTAFSSIVDYICKYECDLIIFGFQKVKNGAIVFTSECVDGAPVMITDKRELYLKVLLSSSYNSLCRKVIKRECITKLDYTNYYHIRIAEDLLQSIDFYKHASKVLFVNDVLYNYYLNNASVTHSVSYNKLKDTFEVHSEIEHFLDQENVFNDQDYQRYYKMCIEDLAHQIYIAATSTLSIKEITNIYRRMKKEDYVLKLKPQVHGKLDGFNCFVIKLFWRSYYSALISLCKTRVMAASLVKKIIRR